MLLAVCSQGVQAGCGWMLLGLEWFLALSITNFSVLLVSQVTKDWQGTSTDLHGRQCMFLQLPNISSCLWTECWWGLALVSGWPTVGSAAGTWASGGSCCLQRAGRLLLGVVASSYPLYIALTTRWRHRLILRECKFHHGNNYNLPFSEIFPPGISQFTYRVYRVH